VGFCIDAGDLEQWFFSRGTAAKSGWVNMASAKGFDFISFARQIVRRFSWRIVEINTGAETSGVATLNACTANTAYSRSINAAVAVVTSIQLGDNRIYGGNQIY
jgi:hypothetical protein